MLIVPISGWMNPAIELRRVDLPQPEGPSKQTNSPLATVNVMWEKISLALAPFPNDFETPVMSR